MASGMGEYGVEVQNRFNLAIDDDDVDPYEILKKQEEGRSKAKKDDKQPAKGQPSTKADKQAPASAKKSVAKPSSASSTAESGKPQQNGSKVSDAPPRANVEARSARPPRQRTDRVVNFGSEEPRSGEERPPPRRQFEEGGFPSGDARGGTRGFARGGRGFGGRGGGGFNRSEKREYDRHSGSDRTGVKPVDKKEGGGSHNWGTVEDDLQAEAVVTEGTSETSPPEDTENQDPNAEQPSAPQEEANEPQEMTLDEWKAQQNKFRVKSEFNTRKPNEGVDNKQWKNTFMLTKPKDEEAEEDASEESEEEEEVDDTRAALNKLNIKITFNDNDRGYTARRRGRGGRGGDRNYDGFRGRGGFSSDNAERPSFSDNAEKPVRERPYNNFGERGGFGGFNDRGGFSGRRSFAPSDEPQGDQDQQRGGFGSEGGFGRLGEGGFGRGGFRGGERRGTFNRSRGTPRKEEVALCVNDENDFPALGKGK